MRYKRKKGKRISKAKKYHFNGVDYKSGLELKMAKLLTENKIPFKYEPTKFNLQEGFVSEGDCHERQSNGKGEFKNRGNKKILPITYTPDFIGKGFAIETKGYANESFPIKWKMFKKYLHDKGIKLMLFKPQTQKECEEVIRILKQC